MDILSEINQSAEVIKLLSHDHELIKSIKNVAEVCVNSLRNGNKIIFAGNGGSAADAQHFAAELVGRFYFDRPGLPSIALNTDTSMLTAIGNDYGFEKVFSRQVEANAVAGDIFFGISTSGSSNNIIKAIETCGKMDVITVGLTSVKGRQMKELCDYCLMVNNECTPRIQEAHTVIGHVICAYIEDAIYK